MNPYLTAVISIALGAVGQFLLKLGADRLREPAALLPFLVRMFTTPAVLVGLVCFGSSMILWVLVLRALPLSTAYPMVSLSYVLVAALSAGFLHEALTVNKLTGLALIIAGVALVGLKTP